MTETVTARLHWSFWLIGAVALVWNLMGGMNFLMQIFAPDMIPMPEWWRNFLASRPVWVAVAMAIGVFGGVLGCGALLLRKSVAYGLFILSLVATVLVVGFAVQVPGAGARQIFEGVVMPIVVAGFLVWYARLARTKGWIS